MLIQNLYKFIGETEKEVDMVIDYFQEWMMIDKENIVLMIGALSEMSLNDQQKKRVQQMMIKSLEIIEEKDLPVLIQTFFKTIQPGDSNIYSINALAKSGKLNKIISGIRKQCAFVNEDSLYLICEVTSNYVSLNISICDVLLKSVRNSKTSSKYDIFILFICLEKKIKDVSNKSLIDRQF